MVERRKNCYQLRRKIRCSINWYKGFKRVNHIENYTASTINRKIPKQKNPCIITVLRSQNANAEWQPETGAAQ